MKRKSKNKYLGTKFNAVPKHIPAYHGSGTTEVKKILPPLRDHRDIDVTILSEVMNEVAPDFDMSQLKLTPGLCEIRKLKFRFDNLKNLLKNLQQEGYLDFDDFIRKSIEYRYNRKFQNNRYEKRHGNNK